MADDSNSDSENSTLYIASDKPLVSQIAKGTLVKRGEGDLLPNITDKYKELMKENGLSGHIDIYAYTQRASTNKTPDLQSEIKLFITDAGKNFFIVNEAGNKWTPDYMRATGTLLKDAEIKADIEDGTLTEAVKIIGKERVREYNEMSQRLGFKTPPELYVCKDGYHDVGFASSTITDKGQMYIIINKSYLDKLTPQQLEFILGHEEGHFIIDTDGKINDKNTVYEKYLERMAEKHNDTTSKTARKEELDADSIGAGPRGVANPKIAEQALGVIEEMKKQLYFKDNPGKTMGDYEKAKAASLDIHPSTEERVAALEKLAKEMGVPATALSNPVSVGGMPHTVSAPLPTPPYGTEPLQTLPQK